MSRWETREEKAQRSHLYALLRPHLHHAARVALELAQLPEVVARGRAHVLLELHHHLTHVVPARPDLLPRASHPSSPSAVSRCTGTAIPSTGASSLKPHMLKCDDGYPEPGQCLPHPTPPDPSPNAREQHVQRSITDESGAGGCRVERTPQHNTALACLIPLAVA